MALVTEKFLKNRLLNSKISVFLATTFSVLIMGILGIIAINYNALGDTLKENISFNLLINHDVIYSEQSQKLVMMPFLVSILSLFITLLYVIINDVLRIRTTV